MDNPSGRRGGNPDRPRPVSPRTDDSWKPILSGVSAPEFEGEADKIGAGLSDNVTDFSASADLENERLIKAEKPGGDVTASYDSASAPANPRNFADQEAKEFFTGTVKNLCMGILKLAADAHGLGVALRAIECVIKVAEWAELAQGLRGLEVGTAIPVGVLNLEISAHLGSDGPPVTFCAGLSGESPVGVPVADKVQVGPGEKLHEAQEAQVTSGPPQGETASLPPDTVPSRPVVIDAVDYPEPALPYDSPDAMIAGLRKYAKDNNLLLSNVRQRKTKYATVWHGTTKAVVVLIYVNDKSEPSWEIAIWKDNAGQLKVAVRRHY